MEPFLDPDKFEVELVWSAALQDAELSEGSALLRRVAAAKLASGDRATSWPAGVRLDDELLHEFGIGEFANQSSALIVLAEENHPVVLAALMRHELQHVRQFETDPALYRRFQRAVHVLVEGGGTSSDYQTIPMELEANFYASRFARSLFGDEAVDRLGSGERPLLGRKSNSAMDEMMRDFVRRNSGPTS